jgi:hypothetical protein
MRPWPARPARTGILIAGGGVAAVVALGVLVASGTTTDHDSPAQPPTGDHGVKRTESPDSHDAPSAATATRRGWDVAKANTGMAARGLTCDELPVYHGNQKPPAGTTISGQRITGPLDLSSGDITIAWSCIQPTAVGSGLPILTTTDFTKCSSDGCPVTQGPVTISNSEIDGSLLDRRDSAETTGFLGIADLRSNYVHDVGSGIALMNTGHQFSSMVEGNYVTGLTANGDSATSGNHSDAFTVRDFDVSTNPGRTLQVRNNRFDCDSGNDTGAFFIQTYGGPIANLTATGNLLEGGGYQLGLNQEGIHEYSNLVATDNRFSGTGYGAAYVQGGNGWTGWDRNFIDAPMADDHRGTAIGRP